MFVLFIAALSFQFYEIKKIKTSIEDIQWDLALNDKNQENTLTPDVGVSSFKNGYSIELESVKYIGDGLYLKGFIGNPHFLSVYNLTLSFQAYKPLYEYREEFKKNHFAFIFGLNMTGEAQSATIETLNPSQKALFEVTIPNVKQTKEGIYLTVTFKGARYSYK